MTAVSMSPTAATARRRVGAYLLDVVLVGIPAAAVAVIVPVIPVGLIIWVGYRLFAAVSGRSLGRTALRWKLTRGDGTPPGVRGVMWCSLAATVPVGGLLAAGAALFLAGPSGWSWLWWVPAAAAAGAVVSTVTAAFLWSGLRRGVPRVDRWAKLVGVRTDLSDIAAS